jgi:hypothetical protein
VNQQQHEALVARDHAAASADAARDHFMRSLAKLRQAENLLKVLVDADKTSWYATPGIEQSA